MILIEDADPTGRTNSRRRTIVTDIDEIYSNGVMNPSVAGRSSDRLQKSKIELKKKKKKKKKKPYIEEQSERKLPAFPFKPYSIQSDFMNALYQSLDRGGISMLESPTGLCRGNSSTYWWCSSYCYAYRA